MAALTAPGQKLVGGGRRVRSFSVTTRTVPGQKLLGGGGGTDGAWSEACRWRHRRRRVRSLSVAAPAAPGQKLFGGGTDGAVLTEKF